MNNGISSFNDNKFMSPRPESAVVKFIIITYSVCEGDIEKTIATMHNRGTSVHYTIGIDGFQNQYHDENQMAFYAGKSYWNGTTSLNKNAIGIMLINDAKSQFPKEQISKLVNTINDIQSRHEGKLEILGLGEATVNRDAGRHIAPGERFPWELLAEQGIGKKINVADKNKKCDLIRGDEDKGDVNKIKEMQEKLVKHGYGLDVTGKYDEKTYDCIKVFVDRYVPNHPYCWSEATEDAINQLNSQSSEYHTEL